MKKLRFCAMMLLFLTSMLGSVFAVENLNPSDNLDTLSNLKVWFNKNKPFTIYGQQNGCSAYPDQVRNNVYSSSDKYRTLKELFSGDVFNGKKEGLVNIYMINKDGSWKYINEKWSYEQFFFLAGKTYAIEFYECKKDQNQKQYETPDGFKAGDIVCKEGRYLAEVVFTSPYEYEYKRVAVCKSGCFLGEVPLCESPTQENLDEHKEYIGNGDNSTSSYWEAGEVDKRYSDIIKQIEDEIVKIDKFNDLIKKRNTDVITQSEYDEIAKTKEAIIPKELLDEGKTKGLISGVNKVTSDIKKEKSGAGIIIFAILLVAGVLVYLFRGRLFK